MCCSRSMRDVTGAAAATHTEARVAPLARGLSVGSTGRVADMMRAVIRASAARISAVVSTYRAPHRARRGAHHAASTACLVLVAGTALVLSGCVSRGALIAPSLPAKASAAIELTDTPFYSQSEYQCGPAALTTVLDASGANTNLADITSLVYIPQRQGSLQIELRAAPRRFGRMSYEIDPDFNAILGELNARRPVLVLHNYGVGQIWPRWHYAVVIGYDSQTDSVTLRSGPVKRQTMSARNFMRAWDNGGRWGMVVLRPGELPVDANRVRFLEAAASLEAATSAENARLVFDSAVRQWPDEPIALIGRGTAAYRARDFSAAARDYAAAVKLDSTHVAARNNLAMSLLELGCPAQADAQIRGIDLGGLNPALSDAVRDTREQINMWNAKTPPPAGTGAAQGNALPTRGVASCGNF